LREVQVSNLNFVGELRLLRSPEGLPHNDIWKL
jgi:hypothetical protein